MNFSQSELQKAEQITNMAYAALQNPTFEGQTRVDANNQYRMYWSLNGKLYYTINTIEDK